MEIVNYFGESTPYILHSGFTTDRAQREMDYVEKQLKIEPSASILDIGCGFGRHALELGSRGYRVTGIDPEPEMIAHAQKWAREKAVSIDFVQTTCEEYEALQLFDGAICLFNTFGQVTLSGDNRGLISNAAQVLKPGAHLIVDVPNWRAAVQNLQIDEQYGEDEKSPKVNRQYYAESRLILEIFRIYIRGRQRVFLLKYQLFTQDELQTLFEAAGFVIEAVHGDFTGEPLTAVSPRLIMIGRKN